MDSNKKAAVAILIVLSVILAGVTFYISYALQQDTAPEESNAAIISEQKGYEREKTEAIIAQIPDETCDFYVSIEDLLSFTSLSNLLAPKSFKKVYTPLVIQTYENPETEDISKSCTYNINKGKFIFSVIIHTFNQKYTIKTTYGSEEMLLIIIPDEADIKNDYISSVVDAGSIGNYNYTFGQDKTNSEQCRTILTHKKAHIRFVNFVYSFDDCSTMKQLNKDILNEFTSNLDKLINSVSVN